jgi:hypothetical protein
LHDGTVYVSEPAAALAQRCVAAVLRY